MCNKTKPFWETKTNPITMFSNTSSESKMTKFSNTLKGQFIKADELDNHIYVITLMERFNIGAKKVKSLLATIGKTPKLNGGKTYYNSDNYELMVEVLSPKSKPIVDKSNYISNQELVKMFGFSEFKAWDISRKEKLAKKTFGRAVHYEREKAIEAFSKYKK